MSVIIKTMKGEKTTLEEATVLVIRDHVKQWLNVADVHIFKTGQYDPLPDTTILEDGNEYFALPRNPEFDQPLLNACYEGNLDDVTELLDSGADINIESNGGCTPLYYTIIFNLPNICRLLIDRGIDVNKSILNSSPLRHACFFGLPHIVEDLLKNGAIISDNCYINNSKVNEQLCVDLLNKYSTTE